MTEPVERLFPLYSRMAYKALKHVLLGPPMRAMYEVRTEGLENIPSGGPGIVAANHISFLDSLFIPLAVPRRVTYLAKADYWDSWKTRWFFEIVGQIPVRRESAKDAAGALEAGCRVLENGGLLGIYPEGTRSPCGRLYRGRTGAARMAARTGCPVIPVGLVGTREIQPKDAKLPRFSGEVVVRFGEPMVLTQDEVDADPLALRSFTDGLMYRIRELSGQEYVDDYASKPKRPDGQDARAPAA